MKLVLTRPTTVLGDKTTLGHMSVDSAAFCTTLEDEDRQLEIHGLKAKVYGETCIPRGLYHLARQYSPHFKRDLPLLLDVPFFEMVWIHWGNKIAETLGCILVGSGEGVFDGEQGIINSKKTFDKLFSLIEAAWSRNEIVTLEII